GPRRSRAGRPGWPRPRRARNRMAIPRIRLCSCSPCLLPLVVGATTALVLATAAAGAGIVASRRRRAAPDGGRRGRPAAGRLVVMVEGEGGIDHVLHHRLAVALDRRDNLVGGEVALLRQQLERLEPVGKVR